MQRAFLTTIEATKYCRPEQSAVLSAAHLLLWPCHILRLYFSVTTGENAGHDNDSPDYRLSTLDKVLCSCRVSYLNQTLTSLAELPGLQAMTVYISQDGFDEGVAELVQKFVESQLMPPVTKRIEHWQRDRKPLLFEDQVMGNQKRCCDSALVDFGVMC